MSAGFVRGTQQYSLEALELFQVWRTLSFLKHVSASDPSLQGHFRGNPIYPGIMILNGMVQGATSLLSRSAKMTQFEDKSLRELIDTSLTRIESARFHQMILPGDTMVVRVSALDDAAKAVEQVRFVGTASVDGKEKASCQFVLNAKWRTESQAADATLSEWAKDFLPNWPQSNFKS